VIETQKDATSFLSPAVIAAFVALAGTGFLFWGTYVMNRHAAEDIAARSHASDLIDRRRNQLYEFYGPLLALNKASYIVYARLKEVLVASGMSVEDFRLLDHLPLLNSNAVAKPLVDELLSIGQQTARVLKHKSGLIGGGEWPESFSEFLAHYSILRSAAEGANVNTGMPGAQKIGYYPRQFGTDITSGYTKIKDELESLESFAAKALKSKMP
jgi:hypothetical protein